MRMLAVLVVLLAVLIGVVPYFNNCYHEGKLLALANGKQVPMKCHWTAQGEIVLAIPLLGVGILLAFSRCKETQRALAIAGALLGAGVILLPTALIGVCGMAGASCNLVMKPATILGGILVIAVCLAAFLLSLRNGGQDG